jgi:SlyX protein
MEERLVELELRSAEQQRLLEELSAVLHSQQRELDSLRAEVASLRKRLAGFEELPTIGPAEKPPHF